MPVSNLTTIWEFHVKPDCRLQFEKIYGVEGEWAQLFGRSAEYRGTMLVRDRDRPGRYLTFDHWSSQEEMRKFKNEHQEEYAELDQKCEELTEKEYFVGDFENV